MFSARYWPSRYFAPRYWPKFGATVLIQPITVVGIPITAAENRAHLTALPNRGHLTARTQRAHVTAPRRNRR